MTPRYTEAIGLAARAHEGQVRNGTGVPYITHPVAVAALVAQYGGDEDQQIAGLLHDVLEDGGPHYAEEIGRCFGPRVLRIVEACTDGVPDATGRKPPWKERKVRYLEHLRREPDDVLLVSGCDKLHNGRSILDDLMPSALPSSRALGPAEMRPLVLLRNSPGHLRNDKRPYAASSRHSG
jgi:(p)ppGpp synthase/HD superfamily hydrolase